MTALRITYRKSAIGYAKDQKATVAALGLKKLRQTVEHEATPAIIGMVYKVRHLVDVNGHPADSRQGQVELRAGEAVTSGAAGAAGAAH